MQIPGPHCQRFWFSGSELGTNVNKLPRRFWCTWSGDHTVRRPAETSSSVRDSSECPLPSTFASFFFPPFLIAHILALLLPVLWTPTDHFRPPGLCFCSFLHLVWPSLPFFALPYLLQEASSHFPFLSLPSHKGSPFGSLLKCHLFMKPSLTIGKFPYWICKMRMKSKREFVRKEHCRHSISSSWHFHTA